MIGPRIEPQERKADIEPDLDMEYQKGYDEKYEREFV